MTVARLIRDFSTRTDAPIDTNDVIAELKKRGVKDEIYFWPAELNGEMLKGQLVHCEPWEYPVGSDVVRCADIYYDKTMTDDWQRLVTCKEMLHILDPEACRTASEEEIHNLFEKMALPPDLQDPINDGHAALTDRFAVYQAVAVLFPLATREVLLSKPEKFPPAEIAKFVVDLPLRYVNLVMSPRWPAAHEILIRE